MDHDESLRLMAAEKYLLGELVPELREQFEDHYFGCQECAIDIRAGIMFLTHAKMLLDAPTPLAPAKPLPPFTASKIYAWLRPAIWAPMLAVLLAVIGYQNLVTYPRLREASVSANTPGLLASVSLINANARGINREVLTVHKNASFLIYLDIPGDTRFSNYEATLHGPSGESEWSLRIPSQRVNDTLPIHAPPARDRAGVYILVVSGLTASDQRSEIASYPFELKIRD